MIHIAHLFISPGHNYFGRHGQPAGGHPILEVDRLECVAGRGVREDRFFDFKPDYKGQITFFAMEVYAALCRELQLRHAHPSAMRRNVLTQGVDLNALIGQEFEVQGVRFVGVEECRPCAWMDQALAESAEQWMRGRGGLRARILTDGWLQRTEAVGPDEVPRS